MEKMQALLSDPESMQQLQELAQMLQTDATPQAEEDTALSSAAEGETGSGWNLNALMKVSQLMGSAEKDADTALLLALKPHLHAERQKKVDKAVKLLKLLSVWTVLRDSGMLKDLW